MDLKICIVGPCKAGKTLLCRALAEQPLLVNDYSPTAACRIQEFARTLGNIQERIKIQLWDCSGSPQYQGYWPVLAREADGVILVANPQGGPEQERELEQLYVNFAQPNSLTIKQCLVLAIQVAKEGSYGLGGWSGLQGKLQRLNNGFVSINPASPQSGLQEAMQFVDRLLLGCLSHKKELDERQAMGEGGHDGGEQNHSGGQHQQQEFWGQNGYVPEEERFG